MIKGVNKQIIEINYTKNDYVQKAILFINPEKVSEPKEIIDKKALEYINSIVDNRVTEKKKKTKVIVISIAAVVLFLIALYLIFCA